MNLIIAADDDRHRPDNPGLTKGREAAAAIGAGLVWPDFGDHEQGSDFNDLAVLHGPEAVKLRLSRVEGHAGSTSKSFSEFQAIIELKGGDADTEFLTVELVEEIHKSGLAKPLIEKLLKAIAKKCGIKPSLLHHQKQDDKAVSQIGLVTHLVDNIGRENVLFALESIWAWDDSGVWRRNDDRGIKALCQNAMKSAFPNKKINQNAVNSMLELFKNEVFRPGHKFDISRVSINVVNGELHYINGKWDLRSHDRDSYRTTQIPIKYDPAATAPRFEQALFEFFDQDPDRDDKAILVCEMFGYCLLSTAKYEKFFFLIGPGANGKSVLLAVLVAFLGNDNVSAVSPVQFENKFQRAHLLGKLANIITELPEGAMLPDAAMKSITSGEKMTAEMKFKAPFDFEPFATIVIASNHLPHTRDFSPALFRRAKAIPFNRVFLEHEQDKNLAEKLKEELPGILNLALAAIGSVFERGYFTETESTKELKNQWRLESDQAAQFCQDCCNPETGHRETSKDLYEAYRAWADDQGINKTLNQNNFTKRLKVLGAVDVKGTGGRRELAGFMIRRDI